MLRKPGGTPAKPWRGWRQDVSLHAEESGQAGRQGWSFEGKGRRAEKPKRKKRKHTAFMANCDEWTKQRLFVNGRLTNSEIRKALANFKQDTPD